LFKKFQQTSMNYKDFENCGLKGSLQMISGKWKPLILYFLFYEGEIRFIELWRAMPRVSKKVLLEQLKQLEDDGIIERIERIKFPPEVYYKLSEKGKELGPIFEALDQWGK